MDDHGSSLAVDCHAHVFSRDALAIAGARYRPEYAATLEAWRSLWLLSGVTHGVLVQPSFLGTDNSELLQALATDRERLRGVAVIEPPLAEHELERMVEAGIRAVRLNLFGVADYRTYASAGWKATFEALHARGQHVECFVDAGRLPEIEPAFEGTAVGVVFDHFGNPGADAETIDRTFGGVARMARARRVGCKLSGHPYRVGGADARMLTLRWIEAAGHESIVWGSDWPWTRHEEGRDYAGMRQSLCGWMEPELAKRVLWDNPAALYRF